VMEKEGRPEGRILTFHSSSAERDPVLNVQYSHKSLSASPHQYTASKIKRVIVFLKDAIQS